MRANKFWYSTCLATTRHARLSGANRFTSDPPTTKSIFKFHYLYSVMKIQKTQEDAHDQVAAQTRRKVIPTLDENYRQKRQYRTLDNPVGTGVRLPTLRNIESDSCWRERRTLLGTISTLPSMFSSHSTRTNCHPQPPWERSFEQSVPLSHGRIG